MAVNLQVLDLKPLLLASTQEMGITLSQIQTKQLLGFIDLLNRWNKTHNLTAISDKKEILIKHILDSLSLVPYVGGESLLDIGSGAGLPGIAIAILKPNLPIFLLDSIGKKCHFMRMVLATLGLSNTQIIHKRLQDYQAPTCFFQISARAFASVYKTRQLSRHLLCPQGQYLLMKSGKFRQEDNLPVKLEQRELFVPWLKESRHLLILGQYDD